MGDVLYRADGSEIKTAAALTGAVTNVFDPAQNTEDNALTAYARAFHHVSGRYWGTAGSYEGAYFSYLIPVSPGDTYYLQGIHLTESGEASAVFYTADKELTTQAYTLTASGNYITVPATARYMRIPVHADTVDKVMVLTGTMAAIDVQIPYGGQLIPGLYGDIGEGGVFFSRLAEDAQHHRFKGAKVGCLGDSLTAMGDRWQSRLAELMNFGSVTNYGLSGTTLTSARGEGESTYRDRAPNMDDDLDLVIVMSSINDNGAEYGEYGSTDVSTVAGAALSLIQILREKYPQKDIVFFSHPHTHWEWSFGEADILSEVCGKHSVPFFDMLRFCGMDGTFSGENAAYFTDGIHLTDAGNDRVADYMAACLRTI